MWMFCTKMTQKKCVKSACTIKDVGNDERKTFVVKSNHNVERTKLNKYFELIETQHILSDIMANKRSIFNTPRK